MMLSSLMRNHVVQDGWPSHHTLFVIISPNTAVLLYHRGLAHTLGASMIADLLLDVEMR